ncbi:hypothetical protein TanjilG_00559 [Lupinus angustifolius]|uniref:Bifunctional inhibitor/plant lipid transfer protein/seed storage helical domain-containing protein n=1 Tax=Lupinus angustifolius TaxID=3871 RepID=A0A1J7I2B3_LUPAN|nr:hypothetical protein TanjilG_00559 [Lupinus angustifolius]
MGSKRATNIALSSTFILLLVDQAKSPTIDCCTGIKMVIDKSKRCLCVLIKDHDDPSLGLKINVSLALNLPSACHTKTNLTQCVDLLHLAPKSPEAKVFEGFDKAIRKNSSIPVPSVSNDATGKGTSTSAEDKSSGGWGKRWQVIVLVCEILPFVFISHLFLV